MGAQPGGPSPPAIVLLPDTPNREEEIDLPECYPLPDLQPSSSTLNFYKKISVKGENLRKKKNQISREYSRDRDRKEHLDIRI